MIDTPETRQEAVDRAVTALQTLCPGFIPEVALVLGSGLGYVADSVEDATAIPYDRIPGFPISTVPGHSGRLVVGTLQGRRVAVMQGRVHLYEGLTPDQVVLPARTLRRWGAETFIITNAAGSIKTSIPVGSLVLLQDHINLQGQSCLTGPNVDTWGPRFPDMTRAYSPDMISRIKAWAEGEGFSLFTGVYGAMTGPAYETPAEIRMLSAIGADVVGMSTVQEVLALNHMGARIVGISCVTNLASGLAATTLNHKEVSETALAVSERFAKLILEILKLIP